MANGISDFGCALASRRPSLLSTDCTIILGRNVSQKICIEASPSGVEGNEAAIVAALRLMMARSTMARVSSGAGSDTFCLAVLSSLAYNRWLVPCVCAHGRRVNKATGCWDYAFNDRLITRFARLGVLSRHARLALGYPVAVPANRWLGNPCVCSQSQTRGVTEALFTSSKSQKL